MFEYIKQQIEWLKLFFADDDKAPEAPSHKNLILLALVAVFCVSFLKKTVGAPDIPDVPSGWQLIILVGLGIRAAQSAAGKYFDKKYPDTPEASDGK